MFDNHAGFINLKYLIPAGFSTAGIITINIKIFTFSQKNVTRVQTGRKRHILTHVCVAWFDLVSLLMLIGRSWSLDLQPWHQVLIGTCQSWCVFASVLVAKLSCHFCEVLLMKKMCQILMTSTEVEGQWQELASDRTAAE